MDLFGGGGLVSNLGDLATFYRSLLGGGVLEPASLQLMREVTPQSLAAGGEAYGMGLARQEVGDVACFGHGGFWGALVCHCPKIDLTVAAAATNVTGREARSRR